MSRASHQTPPDFLIQIGGLVKAMGLDPSNSIDKTIELVAPLLPPTPPVKDRSITANAFTPNDLARRYGVNVRKILAWINSGQLRAINLAADGSSKPRWRIMGNNLQAFEDCRAAVPSSKPGRTRKKKPADVIEFF